MRERFDPLVAEWISFVGSPNFNLAEKCLKFAQILEYPDLDVESYVQKINRIGNSLRESVGGARNPIYVISLLNEHLFQNLGFAGDRGGYHDPRNNFLNEVVDRKSGLPITMSILYAEVAKSVGLELKLVGFPGHVLAKYGEEMILDPFNDGKLLGVDDLQGMLRRSFAGRVEFEPCFLDEMGEEQALIRLARNLKNSYARSHSYERAARCADMVLAIEPDSPEDVRDKGVIEWRMLNPDSALAYLNRYLEVSPNAEDVDFVLELIRDIRVKG